MRSFKLKFYTVNFEFDLINASKQTLKMLRLLAIFIIILELYLKMSRNSSLTDTKNNGIKDLFKELYLAPFSYYKDKN